MTGPKTPLPPASSTKPEKKRAQPGDFERQVEQIRKDISTVRSNLAAAEKALQHTSGSLGIALETELVTENGDSTSQQP